MIVPTSTFDAFKWATFGVFFGGLAAAALLLPKNPDRTSPRAAKVRKIALAVLAFDLLLAFVGFGAEPIGTPVVIVRVTESFDGEQAAKTRGSLYGSHAYTFQDGHTESLHGAPGTLVVNDSRRTMRITTQSYGDPTAAFLTALTSKPEEIAPMKTAVFDHPVDYVGNDDPPPQSVEGVYAKEKYWLVWGPAS